MTRRVRLQIFLFVAFLALVPGTFTCMAEDAAPKAGASYNIAAIKMEQTADDFLLRIEGNTPPTYTMYELFDPLRIIIDIADASLAESVALPANVPQGPILDVKTRVLDDQEPAISRIEIVLAEDRGYTVERQKNDIIVTFAKEEASRLAAVPPEATPSATPSDVSPAPVAAPAKSAAASVLYDLEVDTSDPAVTRVYLRTDGPVSHYKKAQLKKASGRPDRMYIDLPRLSLPGHMLQRQVGTALARIRAAQRDGAVRVVFDSGLDDLFAYNIEPRPDGLLVTITETSPAASLLAGLMSQAAPPEAAAPPSPEAARKIVLEQGEELINPRIPKTAPRPPKTRPANQEKSPVPEKSAKAPKKIPAQAQDTFAFAGYQKQKITVDFFKIDLHNVFRLFGEISGINIVVDEGVKGNLTLALNDVPWDFALDIILNLKDLQKEERFNTIVISPKSKKFMWPKTATENIAFKADGSVQKQEAISIKQRLETPKEVVEAKKMIRRANALDKKGKYADALALYEQAFRSWPDNVQLADRMASLCLVKLGMNAKAVHYAKAALKVDPTDYNVALQAAIALANMKKITEAKGYFDQAISGPQPAREALISYAAFAEEYQSYNGALALLGRHGELYGDTLDTMVARARIYDKKGDRDKAAEEYRTILLSGYDLPADLKQYIQGRVAVADNS